MADVAVSMQAQVTHGILGILCLRSAFQIFHHRAPPEAVTSHYTSQWKWGLDILPPCQIHEGNSLSDGQKIHALLLYKF